MHQFKTTNIKGKAYVEVSQRILYFRTAPEYRGWTMESDIISYDDQSCIIRATIKNPEGVVVAVGHAQEDRTSSMINKTSYIENCESSAWGRCLGNLGIGIETSIATADEVAMAIAKQNLPAQSQVTQSQVTQSQVTQSQETQKPQIAPDEIFQKAMDYIKANPTQESLKAVLAKRGKSLTQAQISSLQSLVK